MFEYKIIVLPVSVLEQTLNEMDKTGWQPFTLSYCPPVAIAKSKIQTGHKDDIAIVERALVGLKRIKKTAPAPKDS